MQDFLNILASAGPIGGLVCLAMVVAAVGGHLYARGAASEREVVRSLRVALERDPSPTQLSQAMRRWPEAGRYPEAHQRQELIKQSQLEEGRRANNTELIKGVVRVCIGIAVLGAAIFLAAQIFKPAA